MVGPSRLSLLFLALACALVVPASAGAATSVGIVGGKLVITGDDTEQDIVIRTRYGDTANIYIKDDPYPAGSTGLTAGAGCQLAAPESDYDDAKYVSCPKTSFTAITGSLGGNPAGTFEELDVSYADAAYPVQNFDMGAGDDIFHGSDLADTGIQGGAGSDSLTMDRQSYTHGTGNDEADGGTGDDRVYGYGGNDTLNGGEGKDIVEGEYGNDVIHGGGNSDKIDGGDGDDQLYGDAGSDGGDYWILGGDGSDYLDGGEGDDELGGEGFLSNGYDEGDKDVFVGGPGIDETWYTSRNVAVKISKDGVANDGEMNDSGTVVENDNVGADVERVFGTYGNDILVGSDGNDELIGLPGNDVIQALGGNDIVEGRSGDDQLDAGAGDDKVYGSDGNDKIAGADGNDLVEGGADDDDIDGGAGTDSFAGDTLKYSYDVAGNDTIRAADGVAEPVSCGPGTDTAFVDSTDVVTGDAGNICETKTVTAAAAGGGGGAGAGPGAGPNVVGAIDARLGFALGRLTGAAAKLGTIVKKGNLPVPAATDRPGTMTITAVAGSGVRMARASAAKSKVLGSGKATFFAAGQKVVKVKLSAKGKRALKKAKKATIVLKTSFKDVSGKTTKSSKTIKLKK